MKKILTIISILLIVIIKSQINNFDIKPLVIISSEIGHQYTDDRMFPTLGGGITKNVESQKFWILSQYEITLKIARNNFENTLKYNDNIKDYNITIGINNIKRLGEFAGIGYHFDIGYEFIQSVVFKYGISITTMDLKSNLSFFYERVSHPNLTDYKGKDTSGFVGIMLKINPSDYFIKHK